MQHLKEVDTQHIGDYDAGGKRARVLRQLPRYVARRLKKRGKVPYPSDMVNYLKANKGKLFPALEKAWADNGYKTKGTWEEVYSVKARSKATISSTPKSCLWRITTPSTSTTSPPKDEKNWTCPLFVTVGFTTNAVFTRTEQSTRTCWTRTEQVERPLDFYSPNVYTTDYDELFTNYTLGGNTLFIPESMLVPAGALYSIGAFNALGFAPFGIDGERTKSKENAVHLGILTATNKTLANMTGLVTSHYASSKNAGSVYQCHQKRAQSRTR
jgi:hypothetical protein